MTKQLENALNLPPIDNTSSDISLALQNAKDLEKQLNDKSNWVELHDIEMDDISNKALSAHNDLLDLAMNVDVRHAGEIAAVSAQMLKISQDSRISKADKKLKLLRLQVDKYRIDKIIKSDDDNSIEGEAIVLDRNALLKQIQQIANEDK